MATECHRNLRELGSPGASRSEIFVRFQKLLERAARSGRTVLLEGETGAGKEVAARFVHANGANRQHPFLAINCATLSENLLESELFGHERGAFTGASSQKRGKFEVAGEGTLFLDELGELPVELQAKLLRVLQEREFERVGGTRSIPFRARIVAATNRDLAQEVRNGTFRADLYYRLRVVALRVPPLRERREDIPGLAKYFLERAGRPGEMLPTISRAALARLECYEWPGNVRELQNAMEYAETMADGGTIEVEHLPGELREMGEPGSVLTSAKRYQERLQQQRSEAVRHALMTSGGNYPAAATALGIHVKHLHRLAKAFGLKERAAGNFCLYAGE